MNPINAEVVIPINVQAVVPVNALPIKSIKVLTIESLTVNEIEVLEKISKFKRGMIVGTSSLGGGVVLGGLVALFTGGNVPLTGFGFGVGACLGGGVAWKKMPQIVKEILAKDYNTNLNALFSKKLNGELIPLVKGIENSKSFKDDDLLVTAFRVNNPRCRLPADAVFSLQEVEKILARPFTEDDPHELRYDFWRGDFVPDYETTERVNRKIIAIIQTIIQNLEPNPNNNEVLTDAESKELAIIQARLEVKLRDYHQNMFDNLVIIHATAIQIYLDFHKNFRNTLSANPKLKILNVSSDAPNLGSLAFLNTEHFKQMRPTLDTEHRQKAFLGEHPLAYVSGIFMDKTFRDRKVETISVQLDKESINETEFSIRKLAFEYETGLLLEHKFIDAAKKFLDQKPLDQNYKEKMEKHVVETIAKVTARAPGYIRREIKQ